MRVPAGQTSRLKTEGSVVTQRIEAVSRLARESTANLAARRGLTVVLISVMAALLVGTVAAEVNAAVNTGNYAQQLMALGYDTYVIAPSPGVSTLTPRTCLALRVVRGVRAAVWLTQGVSDELFSGGGPPVVVSQIGGDVMKFMAITDPGAARRWNGEQALVDPANPVVAGRTQGLEVRVVGNVGASPSLRGITLGALAVHLTSLGAGEQGNMVILGLSPASVASCELLVSESDRVTVSQAVPVVLPRRAAIANSGSSLTRRIFRLLRCILILVRLSGTGWRPR